MSDEIQARLDAAAALARQGPKIGTQRSDPRAAVRKGEMNALLANYNDAVGWQLGQAVTAALDAYDTVLIEPLRQQIAWLSLPWYVRAWRRFTVWFARFRPPAQTGDGSD